MATPSENLNGDLMQKYKMFEKVAMMVKKDKENILNLEISGRWRLLNLGRYQTTAKYKHFNSTSTARFLSEATLSRTLEEKMVWARPSKRMRQH